MAIEIVKSKGFSPIELKVTIETEEELKVWYELGNTSSVKMTEYLNSGLCLERQVKVDDVSKSFGSLFSLLSPLI